MALLGPTQDQLPLKEKERDHQQYLLDVILRNQSTFTAQSAYLDALLVFVSISLLLVQIREATDA